MAAPFRSSSSGATFDASGTHLSRPRGGAPRRLRKGPLGGWGLGTVTNQGVPESAASTNRGGHYPCPDGPSDLRNHPRRPDRRGLRGADPRTGAADAVRTRRLLVRV